MQVDQVAWLSCMQAPALTAVNALPQLLCVVVAHHQEPDVQQSLLEGLPHLQLIGRRHLHKLAIGAAADGGPVMPAVRGSTNSSSRFLIMRCPVSLLCWGNCTEHGHDNGPQLHSHRSTSFKPAAIIVMWKLLRPA